ncbi:MAG: hypothetical protein M1824_005035 [Vezdaea acicularis]|nr:MAG: hypothetical protein M1824_005035 [Vezdaea acicularis]
MPPTRALRACMFCALVLPKEKFLLHGCPNCEDFLLLKNSPERLLTCTSQVFEGLILSSGEPRSWVAKWQRMDGYVRGMYAVKVTGQLPEEVVEDARGAGIRYVRRDGGDADEEIEG